MEENETIISCNFYNQTSNIYLTTSSGLIQFESGDPTNYSFMYIDFSEVQVKSFTSGLTDENLKKIMYGKDMIIDVHPIGANGLDGELTQYDSAVMTINNQPITSSKYDIAQVLNQQDKSKYVNEPSVIATPSKSLIPQIIIPSEQYIGADNGLKIPFLNNENYAVKVKVQGEGGKKIGGVNWEAVQMEPIDDEYLEQQFFEVIESPYSYGHRQQMKYITNKMSRHYAVDSPVIRNRIYLADLNETIYKQGSFAFCYSIGDVSDRKFAETTQQLSQPTGYALSFSALSVDQFTSSGSLNVDPDEVTVFIQKDNKIHVKFAKQEFTGGLAASSNDKYPPQCRRGEVVLNNSIIFYPTYNGVVLTNGVMKNAQDSSNEIFLKLNTKTHPKNSIKIKGATFSSQMKEYMNKQEGMDLKWFPTLYQQGSKSKGLVNTNENDIGLNSEIGIAVENKQRISFDSKLKLIMMKSLGNFACCPVFFSKNMSFTLYFKGNYVPVSNSKPSGDVGIQNINTSHVYSVFPIVYNNNEKNKVSWIGTKVKPDNSVNEFQAEFCVTDSDLQQTIYKAQINFVSRHLLRNPLQIFGVIIVMTRRQHPFDLANDNGSFDLELNCNPSFENIFTNNSYQQYITNCNVTLGLDGVNGNLGLDGYACDNLSELQMKQSVGQIDLFVKGISDNLKSITNSDSLFKGFGMQISTSNSDGNSSINVNLNGIQKKLEDMKLIMCPFWDGDRLQAICVYFQNYLKIKIKMVNYLCKDIHEAPCAIHRTGNGTQDGWMANPLTATSNDIPNSDFRVPRSFDWKKPAINFVNGTPCLQALNNLAEKTSCVFCVGLDGCGYFYELNNYGYPYYVDNQTNVVEFQYKDIISISVSPNMSNKYNGITTIGFLSTFNSNKDKYQQKKSQSMSTSTAIFYSRLDKNNKFNKDRIKFPWQRVIVGVQQGFFSKQQLLNLHRIRTLFSCADIFTGNLTMPGNLKVDHLYQKIKIGDNYFFVININHSIDVTKKIWTTTYEIQSFQTVNIDNTNNNTNN